MSKKREQNFGLTEEAFENLLQEMKNGNGLLLETIFLAQFKETMYYLMHRYKVDQPSAYDATMDALLKFRKRLLEGKIVYCNMRFLFTQIARQFLANTFKNNIVLLNDLLKETIANPIEDPTFATTTLDALDKAFKELDERCSTILKDFYYNKIPLKQLSKVFEKTEVAMRKQKERCSKTLQLLFKKYYKK